MTSRRHFLVAAGAGALCGSLPAFAQQPAPPSRIYKIGTLAGGFASGLGGQAVDAFRAGMHDLGYVEGRHYVVEARFAEGQYERYPALAADLVKQNVDAIVAIGGPLATRAAQQATQTTPIVMVAGSDPVGLGFAKSLAKPGGNITGLTNFTRDLLPKQLELLASVMPRATHIALLLNAAATTNPKVLEAVAAAAKASKVRLSIAKVSSEQEIEPTLAALARDGAQGVLIASDPLLNGQVRRIAEISLKHRLASIAFARRHIEAGGLMSYGEPDLANYRRAAYFFDRILKGTKPQDLPIEQPTQVELGVNLKTAKALGITVPQSLLISAEKVIE